MINDVVLCATDVVLERFISKKGFTIYSYDVVIIKCPTSFHSSFLDRSMKFGTNVVQYVLFHTREERDPLQILLSTCIIQDGCQIWMLQNTFLLMTQSCELSEHDNVLLII